MYNDTLMYVQLTTSTILFTAPIMYVRLLPTMSQEIKVDLTLCPVKYYGADFNAPAFLWHRRPCSVSGCFTVFQFIHLLQ
jgi:hypothetical protein